MKVNCQYLKNSHAFRNVVQGEREKKRAPYRTPEIAAKSCLMIKGMVDHRHSNEGSDDQTGRQIVPIVDTQEVRAGLCVPSGGFVLDVLQQAAHPKRLKEVGGDEDRHG